MSKRWEEKKDGARNLNEAGLTFKTNLIEPTVLGVEFIGVI